MQTAVMTKVIRLDSMPVGISRFTDEGYLKDTPILTRTGIFEYRNEDGSTRRELRLAQDVFDKESLASYKGKPIVITHDAGSIDSKNVAENQIGTILSDGYKSGADVRAEIIIHDTQEMRHCGLRELSLGYTLDLEQTSGTYEGEHFDAIQRNIRVNHLALVREARAGETARLNIDSRHAYTIIKGGNSMALKKKVSRADSILSEEELAKAISMYKEKYAAKPKEQPEVKPEEEQDAKKEPVETPEPQEPEIKQPEDNASVEDKIKYIDARRHERDKEGDPENKEEAMGQIARADEDIDMLKNIIDTLLAKAEFDKTSQTQNDSADEEVEIDIDDPEEDDNEEEKTSEDAEDVEESEEEQEDDPDEQCDEDDEPEEDPDEEEEFDADEPEDDEDTEDEDLSECDSEDEEEEEPEEDPDEEEEFDADEPDEDDEEEEDFEDDYEEDACDPDNPEKKCVNKEAWARQTAVPTLPKPKFNADAVDKIVRERVKIGIIGNKLNLDGLENMRIRDAKKKIVRVVCPTTRLDGKSDAFIDEMFRLAADKVKSRKDIAYQRKQMFGGKKHREDSADKAISSLTAREKMMARRLEHKDK